MGYVDVSATRCESDPPPPSCRFNNNSCQPVPSGRQVVGEGVGGIRGSSGASVGWTRAGEGEMARPGDKISGGEMISSLMAFLRMFFFC